MTTPRIPILDELDALAKKAGEPCECGITTCLACRAQSVLRSKSAENYPALSALIRRQADALGNLVGQVEQARDGFDIWPYRGSDSMALALAEANAVLAALASPDKAEGEGEP